MPKIKIWANFQRNIELFTQKTVTKLSNIWVWDPGSGKNLFRIPGSKIMILYWVIKSLEQLKNFKNSPVPYLGLELTSNHTCHQKPNPSREIVPLKIDGKCRDFFH
jgi:hypothetical protein